MLSDDNVKQDVNYAEVVEDESDVVSSSWFEAHNNEPVIPNTSVDTNDPTIPKKDVTESESVNEFNEELRSSDSVKECCIQSSSLKDFSKVWKDPPSDQIIYPVWTFGFNHNIPIVNLSMGATNIAFYSSGHLAIIADLDNKKQRLLRGHCNEITCITCSKDRRWLASGDRGPSSAVIIWDAKTGDTVRTMISPHNNGVIAIALTGDARYLATLSAGEGTQEFSIWKWTTGSEQPLCTILLEKELATQKWIRFNPEDYYYVVTTGSNQVVFYKWDTEGHISAFSPILTDETFEKKVGSLVGTSYVPETNVAVTATSQGLLVVWILEKETLTAKDEEAKPIMKPLKMVPIHERAITFLTITRSRPSKYCIVTGDAAGTVKFFDTNYTLLYWYQDLNAGPIVSIGFSNRGILDESSILLESTEYPQCSTIPGERFVVEDFLVSTGRAKILNVKVDGGRMTVYKRGNHEEVTGVAAHPQLSHIAVCSLTGQLKIYDYEQKGGIGMRDFGIEYPIQSCCYSQNGFYIAVGFVNGHVRIVDALTFKDVTKEPFAVGRGAITHVDFSPLNDFCAYADAAFTTTLLRAGLGSNAEPWVYVGRIRVHYRKINDLRFWQSQGSKRSRLFTVGDDRTMVEYDLHKARRNTLELLARHRITQMSVPLCFGKLPPYYKEEFLLVSTNASKFKLLDPTSFMCRKVVMTIPNGVRYRKMRPLPSDSSATAHFILCMSEEKLTVIMLPLDGDPLKSTNIMAHPSGERGRGYASDIAVSHDGRFVFTVGGPDTAVHMWGLNTAILEERIKSAGHVKHRFYDLVTPEFLNELKDFYYYSMLRTQGIKCMDTRQTSMTIPISEIPFVMRAVGHYPTEEEITDMLNEVKYSKFAETGQYVEDIDLDTFIQMYCNYRPHHGILYKEVEKAFERLCRVRDCETGRSLYFRDPREKSLDEFKIPPEYLFSHLQTLGEPIGEAELTEYLAILLGAFPEGGRPETTEPIDEDTISKAVDSSLPMFLNTRSFVQTLLGFKLCEKNVEEDDYIATKLRMGIQDYTEPENPPELQDQVVSRGVQICEECPEV